MSQKKILVLGGTQFVGRVLVEKLSNMPEYDVTLFNRSKTNNELFPDLKRITGDRETDDHIRISEQNWDVVIDFSGYYPLTFRELLDSLRGKVKKYIFISTISVFDIGRAAGEVIFEGHLILECTQEKMISRLPDGYGEKKAEMERILLSYDGMEIVMLRPSFIYGRYDWTDRLYYWLWQAANSDEILVPADDKYFSLTYGEDLAQILIAAIDKNADSNVYHTITEQKVTLTQVVQMAADILGKSPRLVPITDEQLGEFEQSHNVLPLHWQMAFEVNGDKCLQDYGIAKTSFRDAIAETLAYGKSIGWPRPTVGLNPDKQSSIINSIS